MTTRAPAVLKSKSFSQGPMVSRSQGLKVTGGLGVTGVTGMKVNVICEAVEVILRVP